MKHIIVWLLLICSSLSLGESPDLFLPAESRLTLIPQELPAMVVRRRSITMNMGLLEAAKEASVPVTLNLFEDIKLESLIEEIINRDSEDYSLIGATEQNGNFIITVNEDVVLGNIRVGDEKHYQIYYNKDKSYEVREIDDSVYPLCGNEFYEEWNEIGEIPMASPAIDANIPEDDGSVFDVMVVYTPKSVKEVGGIDAMIAHINLSIDESNIIYANSGINSRVRLVHHHQVDYFSWQGFNVTLNHLKKKTEGYMDEVHELRDKYGADLVILFINDQKYCGLGYLMKRLDHSFEDRAFSVVWWYCATGYYSFIHELGHNMGCHHATPEIYQGAGLYPYSMGYRFGSAPNRTVMAYAPGSRIMHFSNPNIFYSGERTGVLVGDSNEANNALNINNVAKVVANWRNSYLIPSDGDVNRDGQIDSNDFVLFVNEYGKENCVYPTWCDNTDLNKNGVVEIGDASIMGKNWLDN